MIDDLGQTVPSTGIPVRVVSLVPSLTEAVALTVPGCLVGATDYCIHPSTLDVVRVGGSKYPRIEAVAALEPDLVLANAEENRPEDVKFLRDKGIPVWVMAAAATVPDALESLHRLFTQIFEITEPSWLVEARRLWEKSSTATEAVRARAVVPVWRKPWVILGRDTFAGDVLRRLCIEVVYFGHNERYPRPALSEIQSWFASGKANLLVLPDEPYEFKADDGSEEFPGVRYLLVSGRFLTWYGPSLVEAHKVLSRSVNSALG